MCTEKQKRKVAAMLRQLGKNSDEVRLQLDALKHMSVADVSVTIDTLEEQLTEADDPKPAKQPQGDIPDVVYGSAYKLVWQYHTSEGQWPNLKSDSFRETFTEQVRVVAEHMMEVRQ